MGRTDIDIDDDPIETVVKKHHLKTEREAVDFSPRRAAGSGPAFPLTEEPERGDRPAEVLPRLRPQLHNR